VSTPFVASRKACRNAIVWIKRQIQRIDVPSQSAKNSISGKKENPTKRIKACGEEIPLALQFLIKEEGACYVG